MLLFSAYSTAFNLKSRVYGSLHHPCFTHFAVGKKEFEFVLFAIEQVFDVRL